MIEYQSFKNFTAVARCNWPRKRRAGRFLANRRCRSSGRVEADVRELGTRPTGTARPRSRRRVRANQIETGDERQAPVGPSLKSNQENKGHTACKRDRQKKE